LGIPAGRGQWLETSGGRALFSYGRSADYRIKAGKTRQGEKAEWYKGNGEDRRGKKKARRFKMASPLHRQMQVQKKKKAAEKSEKCNRFLMSCHGKKGKGRQTKN